MSKAMKSKRTEGIALVASQQFAQVFQAYLECSDSVQAAVREMTEIVVDENASRDEVDAALSTIAEALFPSHSHDGLGVDLKHCDMKSSDTPKEYSDAIDELDIEEITFSEKVNAILAERAMTQSDLAAAVGIGQPAISMLLSRNSRPQRKTVEKIAKALGVTAKDIWPSFDK